MINRYRLLGSPKPEPNGDGLKKKKAIEMDTVSMLAATMVGRIKILRHYYTMSLQSRKTDRHISIHTRFANLLFLATESDFVKISAVMVINHYRCKT